MARPTSTATPPVSPRRNPWPCHSPAGFLSYLDPDRTSPGECSGRAARFWVPASWLSALLSPLRAGGPWLWSCVLRLSIVEGPSHRRTTGCRRGPAGQQYIPSGRTTRMVHAIRALGNQKPGMPAPVGHGFTGPGVRPGNRARAYRPCAGGRPGPLSTKSPVPP